MKTSCSRDERRCDATRGVAAGLVFWGKFGLVVMMMMMRIQSGRMDSSRIKNMHELLIKYHGFPYWNSSGVAQAGAGAALDGWSFPPVEVAWCLCLVLVLLLLGCFACCWLQIGRGWCVCRLGGLAGLGLLKPEWAVGCGKKRRRGRWSSSNPRHCCLNRHEPLAAPAL